MSRHVWIGLSDIHGGSSVAICPPEGFMTDDGGRVLPSPAQLWLWERYEMAVAAAQQIIRDERPDSVTLGLNGDMTDGLHHPMSNAQYMTPQQSHHVRIAHKVIEYLVDRVSPQRIHMTRGTGTHVGKSGELEEGLSRTLRMEGMPMVEDPDTGQVTSYWRRYEIGGLLFDQRHHGRMGQRAHTRGPYMRWYAQDIELEHRLDNQRPPDLAIRSHNHIYGDSHRDHRWTTRAVALPCWILMTEYSHKRDYESLPSIGMVVIVIRDGRDEVIKLLYTPDRPTIIEEEAA